jgi:hypothetical protein
MSATKRMEKVTTSPKTHSILEKPITSADGELELTEIALQYLEDKKFRILLHIINRSAKPRYLGMDLYVNEFGLFPGASHSAKIFRLPPHFTGSFDHEIHKPNLITIQIAETGDERYHEEPGKGIFLPPDAIPLFKTQIKLPIKSEMDIRDARTSG